jgi:predicted amidohydrolase
MLLRQGNLPSRPMGKKCETCVTLMAQAAGEGRRCWYYRKRFWRVMTGPGSVSEIGSAAGWRLFDALAARKRAKQMTTVLTIHVPSAPGRAVNTLVAMREGQYCPLRAKFIFMMPFDAGVTRVDAGDAIAPLIDVDGLKVGLMTCYDLRFPELALSLALQGRTCWCPPAWVKGRLKSITGRRCWRHARWIRPAILRREGAE